MQKPKWSCKEFLSHFNSDSHARFTGAGCPTGRGARLRAPALPGAARRGPKRGSDGDRGRAAWALAGLAGRGKGRGRPRGALPGTARAGPPLWEAGPGSPAWSRGQGPGSWCWCCRPRAAGGARPRRGGGRRAAGRVPGGRARGAAALGGNPLTHLRRRLRVRPLRAEDACPRVASSKTTAGG